MDVPAVRDFCLKGGDSPKRIPTGIYGPLPVGTFALLTGRSSLNAKGVHVHLGIIDADYEGEIQILMSAAADIQFAKGDRIAQLLLLPYLPIGYSAASRKGGFGSTDERNVLWTTQITKVQPKLKIQLAGRSIFGLVDTGSDITIINLKEWPSSIPYQVVPCQIRGVSSTPVKSIGQATTFVSIVSEDGQVAVLKPYVMEVPITILGRDLLEQWGAHIQF